MMRALVANRRIPMALAALLSLGFAVTLRRTPTPLGDSVLYASIARSLELWGVGVPSIVWYSPSAVDHVRFYGPVYFDLVAGSFRLFGISLLGFRVVSLAGALLTASAGAMLAAALGAERTRAWWVFALLLFTPELGIYATTGSMASMAVGWELTALALFVRGLQDGARPAVHGLASGVCLLLAALTTPRTYPFVAAFLVCGAPLAFMARGRGAATLQWAALTLVLAVGMFAWAVSTQDTLVRWFQYMVFILSRENVDVMTSGAYRQWAFSWSSAITPVFAAGGGVMAIVGFGNPARLKPEETRALFALAATLMAGLGSFLAMNFTFTMGMYFAVPLFAVVMALPRSRFHCSNGAVATALGLLLACDAGVTGLRYARVAATWEARDPDRMRTFVREHVPAGAAVIGPENLYFFAVERSGGRYYAASPRSIAEWARWAPIFNADETSATLGIPRRIRSERYLIWRTERELPPEYACAVQNKIATYAPPPNHLGWLGRFGKVWDAGYPATAIYRLAADCPGGYNPTGDVSAAAQP